MADRSVGRFPRRCGTLLPMQVAPREKSTAGQDRKADQRRTDGNLEKEAPGAGTVAAHTISAERSWSGQATAWDDQGTTAKGRLRDG